MTAPDPRVGAIQQRLDAATPGPWTWSPEESVWGDCGPNLETVERGPIYSDGSQGTAVQVIGSWGHDANGISVEDTDAEFIANAPADVAYLLAELRKAHEALARVEALAARLNSDADNANEGAKYAAEMNDGASLRSFETERFAYQQAERLIRAAVAAANGDGEDASATR